MKRKVKIILLGGFLGSGKTTMLLRAAEILSARGAKVGLISNDQAANLVDTALFEAGFEAREVSGSCFCCNFQGFAEAAESLAGAGADVILAEPVGSCTDLASTVVRPIKKLMKGFDVAPLGVLLDPERAAAAFSEGESGLDPDAAYIIGRQLCEADFVVCAKSDAFSACEMRKAAALAGKLSGGAEVVCASAFSGKNVEKWLDIALSGKRSGASKIEVDYDRYAHGEAVLGWLNAKVALKPEKGARQNLRAAVAGLFSALRGEFAKRGAEVGHVKALARFGGRAYCANLTSLSSKTCVRKLAPRGDSGEFMILNARVQMRDRDLEKCVRAALRGAAKGGFKMSPAELVSLTPGRPNPTHRM